MNPLVRIVGTLFFSGRSPIMPGTCGTIVAAALILKVPTASYGAILAILAVLAIVSGPPLADRFIAARDRKDPQDFVWDEAAGMWLAAWRPEHPGFTGILLAFLCFRFFDILKPWPIRLLERLPGGYGVVYDDVAAGILALPTSMLLQHWCF